MKGLKLIFGPSGVEIDPLASVSGVEAKIQGALVNIGTSRGSDSVWPDRGTELLKNAVLNGVPGVVQAQHLANFAAVDTLFFQRQQEERTDLDSPEVLKLTPASLDAGRMDLDLYFKSLGGAEYGLSSTTLVNT